MNMGVLPAYVCIPSDWGVEKVALDILKVELKDSFEWACGYWESNWGSLKEHKWVFTKNPHQTYF